MRRSLALCLAVVATMWMSRSALALPTYSPTCTNCHIAQAGHDTIKGQTALRDLGRSRLDKLRVGALKTFVIKAGTTGTISVNVTNGASSYAVAIEGFANHGVLTSANDFLRYTPDPAWKATGKPAYFVSGLGGTAWSGKATTLNYKLAVSSKTPADYYELFVYVTGRGNTGLWTQFERIYVQVTH